MRLAQFILENVESILVEWENYARSIWPGVEATPEQLRDHAEVMLRSVATDMANEQTAFQQMEKSLGRGDDQEKSQRVDRASRNHALDRSAAGFNLRQLVAEYRALRATVIRLWQESDPKPDSLHLRDMIRFNEAIDQLLAESVLTHTEHLDRSRELLLGILAHDLRNPLSAIGMLAEVLRLDDLDPSALETASQISIHVASMARMIDDLLEFAAMRIATTFILSPAPMDLLPLCREAIAEMKTIHPNHTFQFEPQENLAGEWDAPRLKQLLSNLLGNAAQHGAENRPIILSVETTDAEVVLAVQNQGRPIGAERIASLFEPMKSASRAKPHRSSRNVGLGLYIAREVAIAHGGTIEARSDEKATIFSVRLPRFCRRQ